MVRSEEIYAVLIKFCLRMIKVFRRKNKENAQYACIFDEKEF